MALNIGFIPNCPDDRKRAEQGTERRDPGPSTGVGGGGEREQEEERERVEEEEEGVEVGDFFSDTIDLGFLEGSSAENELFFFEPLLEEKLVGWGFCYLVKWVWRF